MQCTSPAGRGLQRIIISRLSLANDRCGEILHLTASTVTRSRKILHHPVHGSARVACLHQALPSIGPSISTSMLTPCVVLTARASGKTPLPPTTAVHRTRSWSRELVLCDLSLLPLCNAIQETSAANWVSLTQDTDVLESRIRSAIVYVKCKLSLELPTTSILGLSCRMIDGVPARTALPHSLSVDALSQPLHLQSLNSTPGDKR